MEMSALFLQAAKPALRRARGVGTYLLLPGLVLTGLIVVLAPDIWHALYASYEFCRAHVVDISLVEALLMAGVLHAAGVGFVGGLAAFREWRRFQRLSRTLAQASCIVEREEAPKVVLVDDQKPFAFCHGLLRPQVYYSYGLARLLGPAELQAVLLHEEAHAHRRDPLRVFAVHVLAAAFWPVPLVRTFRERYLAWLEVRADYEAVQRLGVEPVATALVKLLQHSPAPAFAAAARQISPTEERVKWLLNSGTSPTIQLFPPQHLLTNGMMMAGSALLALGTASAAGPLLAAAPYCQAPLAG
jgi:Zn-dependent protease with chaperone function